MSGALLKKKMDVATVVPAAVGDNTADDGFLSPYKQIASFAAQGKIEAFEQHDGKLYVATAGVVSVYDDYGQLQQHMNVGEASVRDMAVGTEGIYLLRPSSIHVYSHSGEPVRQWEACSELSDYCSFALSEAFVFVTDRENKNICTYTHNGNFVKFIDSPNRFIIPSLTFGVAYVNGRLYCSNSGRHQVEVYTPDGIYIDAFGAHGLKPGAFCGCCNPVHLTCTSTGEIITSEKGAPRISCYGADGKFHNLLLDRKALGGGYAAYEAKIHHDKLFVAGSDRVTVFQYDELLASAGTCGGCRLDCGLRKA